MWIGCGLDLSACTISVHIHGSDWNHPSQSFSSFSFIDLNHGICLPLENHINFFIAIDQLGTAIHHNFEHKLFIVMALLIPESSLIKVPTHMLLTLAYGLPKKSWVDHVPKDICTSNTLSTAESI